MLVIFKTSTNQIFQSGSHDSAITAIQTRQQHMDWYNVVISKELDHWCRQMKVPSMETNSHLNDYKWILQELWIVYLVESMLTHWLRDV